MRPNTHPRLHPNPPTCTELINNSIALSTAVKNVDPDAEIFGPVAFGFTEFLSFRSATDAGHNATIGAGGGSVNFGFNLNYSGTNAKPTSFTLNGTVCTVQ